MNTYDINDADRIKFSTTQGTGSSLTSSDTGIEAIYNNSTPYGMKIQFPSTNSGVLTVHRGSTEMMNMSALGTSFTDIYKWLFDLFVTLHLFDYTFAFYSRNFYSLFVCWNA